MPCKDCYDENRCDRMGLCQVFAKEQLAKPCTCHPDDNPPKPCPRKFALSECRAAEGTDGVTAAPAPQQWRGLTKDEIDHAVGELVEYGTDFVAPLYSVVEGIERKLRERNGGVDLPHGRKNG